MLKTDNIDSVNQKRLQIKIYNLNVLSSRQVSNKYIAEDIQIILDLL